MTGDREKTMLPGREISLKEGELDVSEEKKVMDE